MSRDKVEGNLFYDGKKDKFVLELIPAQIVTYKDEDDKEKRFEIEDLYLKIDPLEKSYPGIKERLLMGKRINVSLPRQMFEHLAQRHLQENAGKIERRKSMETGELEDIAAELYLDPQTESARNKDSSGELETQSD